jgi:regulation of enolase protein 1 (concanavalin A-like superfamily)
VEPDPVGETVPNKPLGLVAFSALPGRVDLGWTDGSDNETGFRIQRSSGSGNFEVIGTVSSNVTNFADTNVEAGVTYTYNIVSFNNTGTSVASNSREITIPGTAVGTVPNAPSGFIATLSNGIVSFAWNDNSNNETGFVVERSSATGVFQPIGTAEPNVTTFSDSLIVDGSTYTYHVLAFNESGNSPVSNSQVIAVPANTDPTVNPSEPIAEVFTVSDIGVEGSGSSANYDSEKDMFQISTAGGQIWGTKDDFNYVYREIAGDVEATVKISSVIASDKSGQAGIMFRETEDEGSRHAFLTVSAFKGVAFERRTQPDSGTVRSGKGNVSAPIWLRLIKEGTYLSAYYSEDGDNWSFLSEDIIDFPDTIFIGLAVAANGADETVEADFEEFNIVELNSQAATETFISADIGKVGINGDALYDPTSDSFLIEASGGDIGHVRDAFHYVYREVSGDFESIAKIESLVAEEDWAKAGLMVRESLLPNSPYFAIFMAQNVGIVHQNRNTYSGNTDWSKVDNVNTPFWVKISRSGNMYRDFYSLDGVSWTLMNETILELSDPLYVGIALTSHKEGSLAYAEFTNVSVNN